MIILQGKAVLAALVMAVAGGFCAPVAAAEEAEAYVWPLCAQIEPVIAAAAETTPFESLSEQTRAGQSIGYIPALSGLGLDAKRKCMVYVAGTPEGVRGGGKYNYLKCETYRSPFGERLPMSSADPERQRIGGILGTCAVLKDWVYSGPQSQEAWADRNDTWTHPETGVEVLVEQKESRIGCKRAGCKPSVTQEVALYIRKANPSYIDPDEAFRQMKAKQAAEAEAAAKAAAE